MVSRTKSQGGQRAITRAKIRKLQKAGLISNKIDPNKSPSKITKAKIYKYRSVLSGKQAAVKLSSAKKAKALRDKIGQGGGGKVVIVPREKGERFRVDATDTIKSTRRAYGQTINKTIGDKFLAPRPGEKVYYTIPRRTRGAGSLKRRTFASFDELLFYLEKYEIDFEELENYIEVERTSPGSRLDKRVGREYRDAKAKLQRAASKRKRRANKRR